MAGNLSPTAALRRYALQKGLLGGRRVWLVVGTLLWSVRWLRRLVGRREVVVARDVLRPGETITVRSVPRRGAR